MSDSLPICTMCRRPEKEVQRLVLLHRLYMCNDCCSDCMKLLEEEVNIGDTVLITGSSDEDDIA